MSSRVVFLGPQRFGPTLASAVRSLGIEGDIGTVTAGWQEREAEDAELRDHLGSRAVNLLLHKRGEDVFASDRQFAAAHGLRQERLRQLQAIYRLRLAHAKDAAREMLTMAGDRWLLEPERQGAIDALRALDAHHQERIAEVHRTFDETVRPHARAVILRHRAEIEEILSRTSALAIAGGHVAVLLNRLKIFGVLDFAATRPILAWSAGAMALAERIVLFHDSPPQGMGSAEILGQGLGIVPGVVPLPHAKRRLHLDDPKRMALFSRRFAPAVCVTLDQGSRLDWDGERLDAGDGTFTLLSDGTLGGRAAA